jgi:L-ascorbate metabolism protein UlaG (beta-lactamase superfamily)
MAWCTDVKNATTHYSKSPAWNGKTFENQRPTKMGRPDFATMKRFFFERGRREPPGPLPSQAVDPIVYQGHPHQGIRVTWLGHSTAWIEIGGFTILIDPVWCHRSSPTQLAGPKRFQPVPIPLHELPVPNVLLVSHDHFDHLDKRAVIDLARRDARIITPLGVGARMRDWGIAAAQIHEIDWNETWEPLPGLAIHALPAQHFSGRSVSDRNATLWAAWCMEVSTSRSTQRVFFGGDGGLDAENFAAIGKRFGGFDLTMLEIGAADPAWADIHLGPANALTAHELLSGGVFLPVHWATFNLGLHDWDFPGEELLRLLSLRTETRPTIALPKLGQSIVIGESMPKDPWWRSVVA